jgi:hypothetical protein
MAAEFDARQRGINSGRAAQYSKICGLDIGHIAYKGWS